MEFKKNIIRVFSANFLTLLSGVIITFIVPSFLSIESYSYLKTYTFYVSYITCLHLGFVDGMYLKYGGKDINDIDMSELKCEHRIFSLIQIIITVISLLISFILDDNIILILAMSIIPINLSSFYKQLYQSTGQFKKYSKVIYSYTVIYLVLNILLVFIVKSNNYILYCLTTFISNLIIYILLELKFSKKMKQIKFIYNKKVWLNIRIGVFILIGNFAMMFFYALDRWFVKLFFEINDFAYYSFAISMLNIINTLISAVSSIFYNYVCKSQNESEIIKCKRYLTIISSFLCSGYFILAIIISTFLNKYTKSLSIIAISFAGYPFIVVINSLYVNLYKVYKDKKKYVLVVAKMIIISTIYNGVAILISKKLELIALSTTIAFITWYIYSLKDFKFLKPDKNEFIYLIIVTFSFLFLSHIGNVVIGGILYLAIVSVSTSFIYKEELYYIIYAILNRKKIKSVRKYDTIK